MARERSSRAVYIVCSVTISDMKCEIAVRMDRTTGNAILRLHRGKCLALACRFGVEIIEQWIGAAVDNFY